jgi:hypothetical protein
VNKNPLTTTVIIFALGDAYTVWEAIVNGEVNVFTAIAWAQGVAFFTLYLKKSIYAGSYLFYSILPFFPVYFGLKAIGLNPPPTTWQVYAIAFVIYAVAMALLWKQKRDYDRYLLAIKPCMTEVQL